MKEDRFVRENSALWQQLEHILKKVSAGRLGRLERSELDSLLPLYNRVCGHLSYSRTFYGSTPTTEYLNRLVASAHGIIYTARSSSLKKLLSFYTVDFPLLLKRNWAIILLSTLMFLAGFLASFTLTAMLPENAVAFVPWEIAQGMELENYEGDTRFASASSSFILTNNIRVGLTAFALGVTAGLGTAVVLLTNGALLGALAAIAFGRTQSVAFWALILPHGVLELFAIFVCGAAGLLIGWSLISPGELSRKDALISASKGGMKLVAGTIPIFVVAGLIEGFVTPSPISIPAKYAVALLTLFLLASYITFFSIRTRRKGRDSSRDGQDLPT